MSNDNDEIPVEVNDEEIVQSTSDVSDVIEENDIIDNSENESSLQKIKILLENEKQKSIQSEDKLKRTLADFQNLEKKSRSDIQNGLNM